MRTALAMVLAAGSTLGASASIKITEFSYQGNGDLNEYIELTNIGNNPIDLTGWSFDDDSRAPGTVSLSSFGVVAAGESVIITEASATTFRSVWGLAASVKVLGGNTTNLGRNDEINVFRPAGLLADRITYGDQNIPGTIRPRFNSANAFYASLGDNAIATWVLASNGDTFGSHIATTADVGSPGFYAFVPAPGAALGLGMGVLVAGRRRR